MLEALREADQRKSDFIAMLSHELRNPLAAIRFGLHVLEHGEPGSAPVVDSRTIIDRQVGQLVRLVDDLLDVTRITRNKIQLKRQRLELNELVRATVDDNRHHFESCGVRVDAALASAPIHVNADSVRIAQVLTQPADQRDEVHARRWHRHGVGHGGARRRRRAARRRQRRRHRPGAAAPAVPAVHAGRPHAGAFGRRPRSGPGAGQGTGRAPRRHGDRAQRGRGPGRRVRRPAARRARRRRRRARGAGRRRPRRRRHATTRARDRRRPATSPKPCAPRWRWAGTSSTSRTAARRASPRRARSGPTSCCATSACRA